MRAGALAQAVHEVAGGAFAGVPGVLVRGEAVRGEQVDGLGEAARDVTVQVHARGDHRAALSRVVRSAVVVERRADRLGEVALGVSEADDAHGAVDVVDETVERTRLPYAGDEFVLEDQVRLGLHRAAGQRGRVQQRHPLDQLREVGVGLRPRVAVEEVLAARLPEVVGGGAVRAERGRLDTDAADADAQAAAGDRGGARHAWTLSSLKAGAVDDRLVCSAVRPAPSRPASRPAAVVVISRSAVASGRQRS